MRLHFPLWSHWCGFPFGVTDCYNFFFYGEYQFLAQTTWVLQLRYLVSPILIVSLIPNHKPWCIVSNTRYEPNIICHSLVNFRGDYRFISLQFMSLSNKNLPDIPPIGHENPGRHPHETNRLVLETTVGSWPMMLPNLPRHSLISEGLIKLAKSDTIRRISNCNSVKSDGPTSYFST